MEISKKLLVVIVVVVVVAIVAIGILSWSLTRQRGTTGMVTGVQGGVAPRIGQPSNVDNCPCGCRIPLDDCTCPEARKIRG